MGVRWTMEREAEAELKSRVRSVPPDGVVDHATLIDGLKHTFGLEHVGFFAPSRVGRGWQLELDRLDDFTTLWDVKAWRDALAEGRREAIFFDPSAAPTEQQNVALSLRREFGLVGEQQSFFQSIGLDLAKIDLVRALLCDRGIVNVWIGTASTKPIPEAKRAAFDGFIPELRAFFALERKLRAAAVATAGLAAALDLVSAPAFIVGRNGRAEHANVIGRAELDRAPSDVVEKTAAAIRAFERGVATRAEVTRITGTGVPERWLVVLHEESTDRRLTVFAKDWGLTARQGEVLAGICRGDANKTIAQELACVEATVEAHATAIYRKAGVEGRAALIAKVLGG